ISSPPSAGRSDADDDDGGGSPGGSPQAHPGGPPGPDRLPGAVPDLRPGGLREEETRCRGMFDRSMLSRRWSLAVVLSALATAVIVGFAPLVATSECVASSSGGSGHVDEAAEVAARQEVDR